MWDKINLLKDIYSQIGKTSIVELIDECTRTCSSFVETTDSSRSQEYITLYVSMLNRICKSAGVVPLFEGDIHDLVAVTHFAYDIREVV